MIEMHSKNRIKLEKEKTEGKHSFILKRMMYL